MSTRIVYLEMSAAQTSIVGRILSNGYYGSGVLRDLIDCAPGRSGYPHNGGMHSLSLRGKQEDIMAWLDMFEETTNVKLKHIRERLNDRYHTHANGYELEPTLFAQIG